MQIKGTEWYTAFCDPSLKDGASKAVYGYRMPVLGKNAKELEKFMASLKAEGVDVVLRTSQNSHVAIPVGSPFIQVLDEKSAIALEKIFLKQGIELPQDRYKEYGLEYINRTPNKLDSLIKKSLWDRLFGRK